LKNIEDQILSDKQIHEIDKQSTVREVDVVIPDEIDRNKPDDEPIIEKETGFKLGEVHLSDKNIIESNDEKNEEYSKVSDRNGQTDIDNLKTSDDTPKLKDIKENIHPDKIMKSSDKNAEVKKVEDLKISKKPVTESPSKNINTVVESRDTANIAVENSEKAKKKKSRGANKLTAEEFGLQSNMLVRGERLMEAILEMSPEHEIVAELKPHLDSARRDLDAGKIKSAEDKTIKHVLLILEDLYVRLDDEKVCVAFDLWKCINIQFNEFNW